MSEKEKQIFFFFIIILSRHSKSDNMLLVFAACRSESDTSWLGGRTLSSYDLLWKHIIAFLNNVLYWQLQSE